MKEEKEKITSQYLRLVNKFSSIEELKKRIKQLLRKKKIERKVAFSRKEPSLTSMIEKNYGYLIWQGKSTYGKKIFIEILPADY